MTLAPILVRLVSKCFDADLINLGVAGSGIVAAGATVTDGSGYEHTGAPASAVYNHKLCFNWGEDVAEGLFLTSICSCQPLVHLRICP